MTEPFLKVPAMTKATFEQDEDTSGRGGDIVSQDIEIECIHVPGDEHPDGNPGRYWVIKTDRWAFSDIGELTAILRKAGVEDKAAGT